LQRFQRVPTADTSNPFVVRDVPRPEESFVVIRLADAEYLNVPYLLAMIDDSFVSRPDTIVVPGTQMEYAMQLILTPMIRDLVSASRSAKEPSR
jgi:phosphoribulokinase